MALIKSLHINFFRVFEKRISNSLKLTPVSINDSRKHNNTTPSEKLDFNNPEIAFKGKTTGELIRALLVYNLLSFPPLVKNNLALMKFSKKVLGDRLFAIAMKLTFYGHFVAGPDEKSITPVLKRMCSFGVGFVLDYSVEEDIPHETAEVLEEKALADPKTDLPQYQVDKQHLDRREKVISARIFFYESEAACDKNLGNFLRCIESAATIDKKCGMTAIKLTALCRPKILLQISEVITKSRLYLKQVSNESLPIIQQHVSKKNLEDKIHKSVNGKGEEKAEKFIKSVISDEEGIINLFPWSGLLNDEFDFNETFLVPDLKTGEMVRLMSHLTDTEVQQFKNMINRFNKVVRAAKDLDVEIMVDAEQTYFQPAISRLTMEMMRKYNTQKGIVYNTYQNYLVSSYNELIGDLEQARRQNFYFRCKLVRGAYMEQERERAKEMNYPDPIQPSYEATSENYHKTMIECLRRIKKLRDKGVTEKKIAVLVASHNEETVKLAIKKMEEIGIAPDDGTVMFGQLFGMCDFISYILGAGGYGIYKYVPYGPVNEVLPYLSRRAVENKGILRNVKKEKSMLAKAIFTRLKKFDLNSNPVGPKSPDDMKK